MTRVSDQIQARDLENKNNRAWNIVVIQGNTSYQPMHHFHGAHVTSHTPGKNKLCMMFASSIKRT